MDQPSPSTHANFEQQPTRFELGLLGVLLFSLLAALARDLSVGIILGIVAALFVAIGWMALRRVQRQELPGASELRFAIILLGLVGALAGLYHLEVGAWAYSLWVLAALASLSHATFQARKIEVFGPLAYYDLVRYARKGRTTLLRVLYVAVLFGGLALTYHQYFPQLPLWGMESNVIAGSPQQLAEFANWFVGLVFWIQNGAILLLTPAYVAGAIAEEKEKGTLPLLLTTHLQDGEIVVGKLVSRLAQLLALLLAGAPLLAITQLWGGVDHNVLIANFTISLLALLTTGAISIACSVAARSVTTALLASYFWVLVFNIAIGAFPLVIFTSPIGCQLIMQRIAEPWPIVAYGCVQIITSLMLTYLASARLRKSIQPLQAAVERPVVVPAPAFAPMTFDVPRPTQVCPDGSDPILWKEQCFGVKGQFRELCRDSLPWLGALLAFVSLFLFIAWVAASADAVERFHAGMNGVLRVVVVLLLGTLTLGVGLRAATTFSRERDQKTLVLLLLLPIMRWELLRSKWLGAMLRWKYLVVATMLVVVAGTACQAIHPLGASVLILLTVTQVALTASIGTWISLVSRTTTWATVTMVTALGFFFVAGVQTLALIDLLFLGDTAAYGGQSSLHFLELVGNPGYAWWAAGFSWEEAVQVRHGKQALQLIVALLVNAGLTLLFLLVAWLRLEREGRSRGS